MLAKRILELQSKIKISTCIVEYLSVQLAKHRSRKALLEAELKQCLNSEKLQKRG